MTSRRVAGSLLSLAFSVAVVAAALGVSLAVVALLGKPAGATALALWEGAFGGRHEIVGTLQKMVPLSLIALGWIVAFSAFRINIGFEGQIVIGGIAAAVIGLKVHGFPQGVHLPLACAAGAAGGAAYAGIAAWLWARRNVNEIISTLLLNLVAVQILSWLLWGPLRAPEVTRAETTQILASARWPRIFSDVPLTWDVLYVPVIVALVAFLLARTTFGFRLRLTGANEVAARYAGVRTVRIGAYALVLSGAIAGLVGSSLILSSQSATLAGNFSVQYGFTGIVVALLARNTPLGVIPAALLFAALRQSGTYVEATVGVSQSLVLVIQGLVIVLLAGSAFLFERYRRRRPRVRRTPESPPTLEAA